MTCEVAVMNKQGIALAADSAVTLTDDEGKSKKMPRTPFPRSPLTILPVPRVFIWGEGLSCSPP